MEQEVRLVNTCLLGLLRVQQQLRSSASDECSPPPPPYSTPPSPSPVIRFAFSKDHLLLGTASVFPRPIVIVLQIQ